jgi:predicted DNA-binding transcriptional regulator YafY
MASWEGEMRRTDRLYALVEELRARAPRAVSRADLAGALEVTPRTVERDILALQQAGVPIWSRRGRGGGYSLDERWSVPPLNFDATEALAVMAALAAARSMPFAAAGRRAELKLLAAMSSGEAARARELAGRLRLGGFAPGGAREIVDAVEQAVVDRAVVDIGYRDRKGAVSVRTVEAHGLQVTPDGSYLVGWCRLRDDQRSFRLDRIVSVRDRGESAPLREVEDMSRRQWGPPRKAEHRTGANPAFARAVAEALPGIESKGDRYAVSGEVFLRVDERDDSALVGGDQTLVLRTIGRDDLRAAIESAWAAVAPKRSVTTQRKRRDRWAALPAITEDDVREVIFSFPGANEGPIWGQDIGFRVGDEKKTRFARFGPPEGGRVGNLLPPDDEGTLVLLRYEDKPSLLAARPDRWFTTPHYGPPDQPGGVITRLSEHRGPEDLAEIAEVLEDAYRSVVE